MWGEKRIVAGFYDGRPNQLLTRRLDGGYDDAVGLVRVGRFAVLSHFLGELTLVAGETVVTFDLSFDNDRAAAPAADIFTVRATAR